MNALAPHTTRLKSLFDDSKTKSTTCLTATSVLKFPRLLLYMGICLLGSCITPSSQYSNLAAEFSLQSTKVNTTLFEHNIFANRAALNARGKTLHIYIEGDGTPWINGNWVASDPTPRQPVMLNLLRLDTSPALLLGRPCYHRSIPDPNCSNTDWTMGRYSADVVASMIEAITQLQQQMGFTQVALFGHSGGGVLAYLIAHSLQKQQKKARVTTLVTLASNLDTEAWTTYHGYLPLTYSLNPAQFPELSPAIRTHLLFGQKDPVVNVAILKEFLTNRPSLKPVIYDGFDHACCWAQIWQSILEQINTP